MKAIDAGIRGVPGQESSSSAVSSSADEEEEKEGRPLDKARRRPSIDPFDSNKGQGEFVFSSEQALVELLRLVERALRSERQNMTPQTRPTQPQLRVGSPEFI